MKTFKRWLNKAIIIPLRDYYYKKLWYYRRYSDMNWRSFYLRKSDTFADRISHKEIVLKEFGHLVYFFKTDLTTGITRKISANSFRNSIVKKTLIEEFQDTLINREDTPEYNLKLNKVLKNEQDDDNIY